MAEEERGGGVQNIWLLGIALGLGLIVVVIYNVHINRVRNEGRGLELELLRMARDIEPGQRLTEQDLEVVKVTESMARGLGKVIPAKDKWGDAIDSLVNARLERGAWLLREHVTKGKTAPTNSLERGNVSFVVPIDQRKTIGTLLKAGARINVVGMLPGDDGQLRAARIIKGVRVLEVGGVSGEAGSGSSGSSTASGGMRSYAAVTIEVAEDLALKLSNVMTHVSGGCWVELPSSADRPKDAEKIAPELIKYSDKAAVVKKPSGT